FQAEDGIRGFHVTGVQTCALPIFVHRETERPKPILDSFQIFRRGAAPHDDDHLAVSPFLCAVAPAAPAGTVSCCKRRAKASNRRWFWAPVPMVARRNVRCPKASPARTMTHSRSRCINTSRLGRPTSKKTKLASVGM